MTNFDRMDCSSSCSIYQDWSSVPAYSIFPVTTPNKPLTQRSDIRLAQTEGNRLVNRLKNTNLEKFHNLCKMHLSFLLHLPGSSLDELLNDGTSWNSRGNTPGEKSKFRHFVKKRSNKENRATELLPVTQETIDMVLPLVDYLKYESNIKQEGLFRKSGHIGRQKLLREKLQNGEDVRMELDSGIYSAHDCASVLKGILNELQEPLLTEKHYLANCQVQKMVESKKLQTLQLLVQLLPAENLFLLQCLLSLLNKVAQESSNKMTSENLGTLFAPHLLMPRKISSSEMQAAAGDLTQTVAFMIENAHKLFKLPQPLVRDIATYWSQMEEACADSADGDVDSARPRYRRRTDSTDEPIHTSVTFADRRASQQAASETDTQMELAQLYAYVSSMSPMPKNQRLLKQFNDASALALGLSPANSVKKHKRTKSFGDSIKKIVSRNHRRRGSSHSLQIQRKLHNMKNTPLSVCVNSYTRHTSGELENTPVLKRPMLSACNTPVATPVRNLFSTGLHECIVQTTLHSSTRVSSL